MHLSREYCFERIVKPHYNQPQRMYHTIEHIQAMVNMAHDMGIELTSTQLMAIWFHDIVYIPGSPHNEQMSTLLMETLFKQNLGLIDIAFPRVDLDVVSQIILDTKTHIPSNTESRIVLDLDMAILAAPPAEYKKYVENIRVEFIRYSDEDFNKGRSQFLTELLNCTIYHTDKFSTFEELAKANIRSELASL